MKSWVVLLIAASLGLGVGIGITTVERMSHEELFLPADFAAHAARSPRAEQEREARRAESTEADPKVEFVNDRVYNFGSMERYSKKSHTFLIKNVGDAPLELKVERSTCECTISVIDGAVFMPGETGEVTVEWTGKTPLSDPDFRQGVEISTNDPEMEWFMLVVTGYVTETIRAFPSDVIVGRVSSNGGTRTEFRLFGFRSEKIDILGTKFEGADTADLYEIEYEPLSKEEVEKEKGASCGVLAKLTIKPGLPPGPINQTIQIQTRVDKEITVYMTVMGQGRSDIVIASSAQFEANKNLVDFGPMKRSESAKVVLQLFVRGEHRRETRLSVGEVDPPGYLKVDIGPPEELNNGKAIRYKVTIEIPAGMRRINRLGAEYARFGRVVLETTHPATKQIPIDVRFAVD